MLQTRDATEIALIDTFMSPTNHREQEGAIDARIQETTSGGNGTCQSRDEGAISVMGTGSQ